MNKEIIRLGSGKAYIKEFTGEIPSRAEIEKEENLLGLVQGGAALEYKPEFYTAEDDLGLVSKTLITKEEVTFKSGIMTWCGKTLAQLCATARVTESNGVRQVKIGGKGNQDGKSYLIHFVHLDAIDGDVRVTIVGKNQAGFSLAFAKDKETVIDAEFKAQPHDSEGTLIIYEEVIGAPIGALTVTSAVGTTAGTTKLTVSPALSAGNSYKYTLGAAPVIPYIGEPCSAGYATWNGTADIPAVTGLKIVVVEVGADGKAKKAGIVTVTAK